MEFGDARLPSRIWEKLKAENGCWVWTGASNGRGTGHVWWEPRYVAPHRLLFAAARADGVIPTSVQLTRACQTAGCCNPAHLSPTSVKLFRVARPLSAKKEVKAEPPPRSEVRALRTLALEWEREWYASGQVVRPHPYPDWSPANTRVVSGPLGNKKFPGKQFRSRRRARLYWRLRAEIVEEYSVRGRWIFRIRTPRRMNAE